jgi:hypothetical protein
VVSGGELDRGADGQPAKAPPNVLRRSRELAFDGVAPFLEVLPAFVVTGIAVLGRMRPHNRMASSAVML